MVTLTKGTKEYVPIKVTQVVGNPPLTSLTGLGLVFDLNKDDEAETVILTGVAAINDGMIALPLIDTNITGGMPVADLIPEGDYNIFIKFTLAPEIPRLGPFKIRVDD
jgi:hypothetical protein